MATEKFSKEQFESALPENAVYSGLESGEHVYKINSGKVSIVIRSSVDASGFAADSGKDSIRMWLVNAETGKPLGKKVDAYTTRVTGWEKRMLSKIQILEERAKSIMTCPKCDNGLMIERKGKYGAFLGCSNYPKCKHTMKIKSKPRQPKPIQQNFSEVEDLLNEVIENETPKKVDFTPSIYQQAIFDFVETGEGNACML